MFIAAVAESFHQIYEALVLVGWPGYRGSLCVSVALSLVASVMLVLITMQGGRLGARFGRFPRRTNGLSGGVPAANPASRPSSWFVGVFRFVKFAAR